MYEYRKLTKQEKAQLVQERLDRGYPPHSPPHPMRDQLFYLLSVACFQHQSHVDSPQRRQEVLDALFEAFIRRGMEIRAWVVLPNHYHLLVQAVVFNDVGRALRFVHGNLALGWNLQDRVPGRQVWYRFTDRAIRSEGHYYTTLNYIHYNPVKHGWSASPYDWVHSSVSWYLEHEGREWLRDLWVAYPVRDYGRGWDDFEH